MPLRYAAVGAELRNWHHASGGSKAHLGGFSAPGRHRRYLLGTDASSGTNDTSSSGSGGSAGKINMLYCVLKAITIYVPVVIASHYSTAMATSTGFVYVSATHGNAPTLQPNKFAKSFAGVMTGEFSFGRHDIRYYVNFQS